jgi:hypothetical protein
VRPGIPTNRANQPRQLTAVSWLVESPGFAGVPTNRGLNPPEGDRLVQIPAFSGLFNQPKYTPPTEGGLTASPDGAVTT